MLGFMSMNSNAIFRVTSPHCLKSPLCLTYNPCKGLGTLLLSSYSLEYTSYRKHFSFLLFSFSFYFLPFSFFLFRFTFFLFPFFLFRFTFFLFPFFLFRFTFFLFPFFLFRFTFFLFPFFPLLCSFLLFMTHVCVLQRCCNLRDRIGWVFITCYAIIYKSILNADIEVTCDELGYILMCILYQLNLSFYHVYNHCTMIIFVDNSEIYICMYIVLKLKNMFKQCSSQTSSSWLFLLLLSVTGTVLQYFFLHHLVIPGHTTRR